MMMLEDLKKEIHENTGKQLEAFKKENRKNKENSKADNSGDRNPRKEIRKHRCEHQQQNTRDRRETLRCRRSHREHRHNNQRK